MCMEPFTANCSLNAELSKCPVRCENPLIYMTSDFPSFDQSSSFEGFIYSLNHESRCCTRRLFRASSALRDTIVSFSLKLYV